MRQHIGSVAYQTNVAFKDLQAFGDSKHFAKENFKLRYDGSNQIDKFMIAFAKEVGIFSHQTYKDYLSVSIYAAKFAQEKFGIKDISKLDAAHIQAFLKEKVRDGASKPTIQKYSSALAKFETALQLKYGKEYNFNIKSALSDKIKNGLQVKERAGFSGYAKPDKLVNHIQKMNIRDEFKIASRLQFESGVRGLKDLNHIKIINNKAVSVTKGGKSRDLSLSPRLLSDLKNHLSNNNLNTFKANYKEYLSVLKAASAATGQRYEASHGLRHNFFENKTAELQRQGMSIQDSWKQVSKEIGHNRIVHNYTR